jgi:hypothetical protein
MGLLLNLSELARDADGAVNTVRFHLRAAFPGYAKDTSPPLDVRPAEGCRSSSACGWSPAHWRSPR